MVKNLSWCNNCAEAKTKRKWRDIWGCWLYIGEERLIDDKNASHICSNFFKCSRGHSIRIIQTILDMIFTYKNKHQM